MCCLAPLFDVYTNGARENQPRCTLPSVQELAGNNGRCTTEKLHTSQQLLTSNAFDKHQALLSTNTKQIIIKIRAKRMQCKNTSEKCTSDNVLARFQEPFVSHTHAPIRGERECKSEKGFRCSTYDNARAFDLCVFFPWANVDKQRKMEMKGAVNVQGLDKYKCIAWGGYVHTAINRADFVSWWMRFNGSPTKEHRHFLTNAFCYLRTYI